MSESGSATQKPLRFRVRFVESGEHSVITIRPGRGRAVQNEWNARADHNTIAHELGHHVGLDDEYVDPKVGARATRRSPGVHHDDSLMATTKGSLKERHGQQIAQYISEALGRSFTATMKKLGAH